MFSHPAIAALIAVATWWIATGVVIVIARRGVRRAGLTIAAMTVASAFAVMVMLVTAEMTGTAAAYAAFLSALVIWAWHEVTFLLGVVTGPRRIELDSRIGAASRFRQAFLVVRDHELALFASLLVIVWLLHDAPNQAALWSFLLLWVMRLSTKLNIFLGAPNAVSDLLPEQLRYLRSYFRTDRTTAFFPLSLLIAVSIFGICVLHASWSTTNAGLVSWSILAAFALLGLLEHLFLVLPIRDTDIWQVLLKPAPVEGGVVVSNSLNQKRKKGSLGSFDRGTVYSDRGTSDHGHP